MPLVSEPSNPTGSHLSGTLRISKVEAFTPQPFTVLGFMVDDIVTRRVALGTKGVTFERYPFMPQDNLDLLTFEGGARVCWFKDPDGNLLSLTQLYQEDLNG